VAEATPTPSRCDGPTLGIAVAEAAIDVVVAVVEVEVRQPSRVSACL
jgi:hypothetical protein